MSVVYSAVLPILTPLSMIALYFYSDNGVLFILSISYLTISPEGVSTSTCSPSFEPISATPTGDSLEILPFRQSASVEPTILYQIKD